MLLLDNASSHRKIADDALSADNMNVGRGGKQPKMRDTIWNGAIQQMVDDMGTPKGMNMVLEESGVNMKQKDIRDLQHILILVDR